MDKMDVIVISITISFNEKFVAAYPSFVRIEYDKYIFPLSEINFVVAPVSRSTINKYVPSS